MDQNIVYVCLLSEHNVAEFQAVKTIMPARIVAVASQFVRKKGAHERFCAVLKNDFAEDELRVVGEELSGDNYDETRKWSREVLRPLLVAEKDTGARIVYNFTGGTKSMVMAIRDELSDLFDEMHYSAFNRKVGRAELQIIHGGESGKARPLEDIEPLEQAHLYSEHVFVLDADIEPPLELLDELWETYSKDGSPYWQWSAFLKGLWFGNNGVVEQIVNECGGELKKKHYFSVPLPTMKRQGFDLEWFNRFAGLDKSGCTGLRGDHFLIPIDRERGKAKHFIKWFAGRWYEDLVVEWLREVGVSTNHIVSNVMIKATNSDTGNEGDILLQRNGRLYLLEAKLGDQTDLLSPISVDKLYAAAAEIGKVSAAFMLTPRQSKEGRYLSFLAHAAAKDIRVLTTKEELCEWLHLTCVQKK